MADNTGETLDLFAGDSHASHSALPGTKMAQQMTAHYGRKCSESFARFSPLGSLVKTLLASSAWNSTTCYLTWKVQATPHKRLIFRLAQSMRTTFAIESGLLPTPTANDYGSSQNGKRADGSEFNGKGMPSLSTIARMIPTPTAGDAKSSGSRNTENSKANAGISLTDYVRGDQGTGRASVNGLWATPSARDWKDTPGMATEAVNPDGSPRQRLDQLARQVYGRQAADSKTPAQQSGSLNPEWVEWLMGYPTGWTDCED